MTSTHLTLAEIASMTGSQLSGSADHKISGIADLEHATSTDASFLGNLKYESAMRQSKAGVIFIAPSIVRDEGKNYLIVANPTLAFQKLIDYFYRDRLTLTQFVGIHPSAVVHPSASLGSGVNIGPQAVIDSGVKIGANSTISSGCYVGPQTTIGEGCLIHPNVVIRERCVIGNRVILQPGAVIGSCGFGYTPDEKGRHIKLNQVGNVVIEDDVEIGANTTIDRAHFKTTRIGAGTKIDNLVQIAHNVELGQHNIIVSQTGIAGSTSTGNHVIIAGQVAINGHIKITSGAVISARTGVSKSITKPGKYGGVPAVPLEEYNRNSVYLRNIEKYVDEIKELKKRLDNLENKSK